MEEMPWYWLRCLGREWVLATPFQATQPLPMVALDDIGGIAALAVSAPDSFADKTIAVAGDVKTLAETAALLSKELTEPVNVEEVQVESVFIYPEADTADTDIAWLRSVYPPLQTLRTWLEEGGGLELCRGAAGCRVG
jgi:uncharacterized protein YbjT (DUF2867 family)